MTSNGSQAGGDSSENEEDERIEAMLLGAVSHLSTAGTERNSLLLLDPDLNSELFSWLSVSYSSLFPLSG